MPSRLELAARENARRSRVVTRGAVEHANELGALLAKLSPKQRAFHDDQSQQVVAICTRQSGKTSGAIVKIADKLFGKPGAMAYVLMPTRQIARDTFWVRWKETAKQFGLTDDHHHETLLETRIPNGSILRLVGVPDRKRADRIRGQTLDLIVIDEAASFADDVLSYLVEDCCDPALGIRGGQLVLTSTPGMQPEGYLYRAYTDQSLEFSRHFFELRDNPAWTDPSGFLARVLQKYGLSRDDPKFVREWLGKWVADLNSRVYRIEESNLIDEAPVCDYHVMAVDLGATDESAICVLGWKSGERTLYCVHEEADSELDLTSVAERVRELQQTYKPLVTMVDGAAKQSVLELENRHGIPLEATPKAPGYKAKAIGQVNADFRRQQIRIPKHFAIVGQMRALQWAAKAIGVRENQGQPNDRCDAFLYAYLRASHYTEQIKANEPERESPEWWTREQERVREAHVNANQPRNQMDPWANSHDQDPW